MSAYLRICADINMHMHTYVYMCASDIHTFTYVFRSMHMYAGIDDMLQFT